MHIFYFFSGIGSYISRLSAPLRSVLPPNLIIFSNTAFGTIRTTAIQANDLLFRKTLRDNGAGLKGLFAEIEADMRDVPDSLSGPMMQGLASARATLDTLCGRANTPREAAVSGVDWLMLLGYLFGGWQMAKSGHLASTQAAETFSPDFIAAKQATCQIYLSSCLPHIEALAAKISNAGADVLSMRPEWLAR